MELSLMHPPHPVLAKRSRRIDARMRIQVQPVLHGDDAVRARAVHERADAQVAQCPYILFFRVQAGF